jgi:hypothetical protein
MNWTEFEATAPELAAEARTRFERDDVVLLGSLRADGSPRITPVEPYLVVGHLLLGLEWPTPKARDLVRDPRCTLHSARIDAESTDGELKLYGRAVETDDPAIVAGPYDAWWHKRQPGGYRVFWFDVQSAAFLRWGSTNELRVLTMSSDGAVSDRIRHRAE